MKIENRGLFFGIIVVIAPFVPIFCGSIPKCLEPKLNRVYRSEKILDSYYFILLDEKEYYYINTDGTDSLSVDEIKSPDILKIMTNKHSWAQTFSSRGKYFIKNCKIYTDNYMDKIDVISPDRLKYLNKIFILQ